MDLALTAELWARLEIDWSGLGDIFDLPPAASLPLPLPTGKVEVDVTLGMKKDLSPEDPPRLEMRIAGDYEIPPAMRSIADLTVGPHCRFSIISEIAPTETEATPNLGARLGASLELEVMAKLPPFPQNSLVAVRTGDAEGWTKLVLRAKLGADVGGDGASANVELRATVFDPFEIDIKFPGMTQDPALHLELDRLGGRIQWRDGKLTGALDAVGHFRFAAPPPPADLAIATYLAPFLKDASLAGTVSLTLALTQDASAHESALAAPKLTDHSVDASICASILLSNGSPAFALACFLQKASVQLHPLALLMQLRQTPGASADDEADKLGIGFGLTGFAVDLGDDPYFALEMKAIIGFAVPAYVRCSRTELRVGLGHVMPGSPTGIIQLPLRLPRISRDEFGFAKGRMIDAASRSAAGAAPLDQPIYGLLSDADGRQRYDAWLNAYFDAVEQLTSASNDQDRIAIAYETGGAWQVKPPTGVVYGDKAPLRILTGCVGTRQKNGSLLRTNDLAIVYQLDGRGPWRALLARPALELEGFYVIVPLQNPRQIRVGGAARFVTEGPFKEISKISLSLELSAEMIFFAMTAEGKANFPIPEIVPGYGGGSFSLGKAMVGFGYTKRSLAMAFSGELVLPERLVDDLDTSDVATVGLRMPVQTKLAFQLDVIPIVMGKVVIPMPLFQFDLDMRKDDALPLLDAATCAPDWDGLQVIVEGLLRCSLKRISYSPLLCIYASSNSNFDGDLELGDSRNRLRVVADDIFWAYGMDSWATMLCAPISSPPFCNNFCVDAKISGFGFHFHLQRPIPSFSPLATFEILALLADPLGYKVAPEGELANMVRAAILDAHIDLPPVVTQLLPDLGSWVGQERDFTLNLATYIMLLQLVGRALEPLADAVVALMRDGIGIVDAKKRILTAVKNIDPVVLAEGILRTLPFDSRRFSTNISLGVFSGKADAFLTTEAEAASLLGGGMVIDTSNVEKPKGETTKTTAQRKRAALPASLALAKGAPAKKVEATRPADTILDDIAARDNRTMMASPTGRASASSFPADLRASFRGFLVDDLQTTLPKQSSTSHKDRGLLLMKLRLAVTAGTTLDFVGHVSADGAASFATAVKSRQVLRLPVSGLLPLSAEFQGRAALVGSLGRDGPHFTLSAHIKASAWEPLPSAPGLRLSFPGSAASAALTLSMSSTGSFSAEGNVSVEIAGFTLSGQMTAMPSHIALKNCRVVSAPWSFIDLDDTRFSGSIGPGHRFVLEGEAVIGLSNGGRLGVTVRISESGVMVSASQTLHFGSMTLGIQAEGRVNAGSGTARVDLDGSASLRSSLAFSTAGKRPGRATPIELDGAFRMTLIEGQPAPSFSVEGPFEWEGLRLVLQKVSLPQATAWGRARVTPKGKGLCLKTSAVIAASFQDPLDILPHLHSRIGLDVELTNSERGGVGLRIHGDWQLAMKPSPSMGFGAATYFPIATQPFDWTFAAGADLAATTELAVRGSEIVSLLFRAPQGALAIANGHSLPSPSDMTPIKAAVQATPRGLEPRPPSSSTDFVNAGAGVVQKLSNAGAGAGDALADAGKEFTDGWSRLTNEQIEELNKDITSAIQSAQDVIKGLPPALQEAANKIIEDKNIHWNVPLEAAQALVGLLDAMLTGITTAVQAGVADIAVTVQRLINSLMKALGSLLMLIAKIAAEQSTALSSLGQKQLILLQSGADDQIDKINRNARDQFEAVAKKRVDILKGIEQDVASTLLRQVEKMLETLSPQLPEISAVLSLKHGVLCLDFPRAGTRLEPPPHRAGVRPT